MSVMGKSVVATSAGIAVLGMGAVAPPAGAQPRTITLTLLGGRTITITVDVPPGNPAGPDHTSCDDTITDTPCAAC